MDRKQQRQLVIEDLVRAMDRAPDKEAAQRLFSASLEILACIDGDAAAPALPARPTRPPTITALITRVLVAARRPLPSVEIVEAVRALAPERPANSVHAEIKRMHDKGKLRLHGPARGGTYELATASA